jgi:RNA polymerase nonessential primary-like sigma factor
LNRNIPVFDKAMSPTSGHSRHRDSIRDYLDQIGKIPLLTIEEECQYGRQVSKMCRLVETRPAITFNNQQWADLAGITIAELTHTLKVGDRAKTKMIQANLRLVVAIAKKYQRHGLELDDLIQEGSFGLTKAVEKYDVEKGYRFSTYAYWWIRQAITRAIANDARNIRIPVHIHEKLNKIKRIQRDMVQESGRNPTRSEVAEKMNMTTEQLSKLLQVSQKPCSLSARIKEGDLNLEEILGDDQASPEAAVDFMLLQEDIQNIVNVLAPVQREVIRMRYGLGGDRNSPVRAMSLEQVGRQLGVSRERARQIEKAATIKLRNFYFREGVAALRDWN